MLASVGLAQIAPPQINLSGNIGCQGFPCVNNGTLIMASDANRTMTALETSAMYVKVTSSVTLTAKRNLIAPVGRFNFTIENATTGGQSIQIIGVSGTGVTIANGTTVGVWNDGTNYVQIGSAGGSGSPGGANHSVQFNAASSFGGTSFTGILKASMTADPSAAVAADLSAIGGCTGLVAVGPCLSVGRQTQANFFQRLHTCGGVNQACAINVFGDSLQICWGFPNGKFNCSATVGPLNSINRQIEQLRTKLQDLFGYHGPGFSPVISDVSGGTLNSDFFTNTGSYSLDGFYGPSQTTASGTGGTILLGTGATVTYDTTGTLGSQTGVQLPFDTLYVACNDSPAVSATMTMTIDGSTVSSPALCGNAGSPAARLIAFTGLTNTTHTVVITCPTSPCAFAGAGATSGNHGVEINNLSTGTATSQWYGANPSTNFAYIDQWPDPVILVLDAFGGDNDSQQGITTTQFATATNALITHEQALASAPSVGLIATPITNVSGAATNYPLYAAQQQILAKTFNTMYIDPKDQWGPTYSNALGLFNASGPNVGLHFSDIGTLSIAAQYWTGFFDNFAPPAPARLEGIDLAIGQPYLLGSPYLPGAFVHSVNSKNASFSAGVRFDDTCACWIATATTGFINAMGATSGQEDFYTTTGVVGKVATLTKIGSMLANGNFQWITGSILTPSFTLNGGTAMTANQGNGASVQHSTGSTTTNDCVKYDANGNTVDAGGACGTGGSATIIQVNGTPTSTATPVNLITSTVNSVGLTATPSNPSVGNVKFEITGTPTGMTLANIAAGTAPTSSGTYAFGNNPITSTSTAAFGSTLSALTIASTALSVSTNPLCPAGTLGAFTTAGCVSSLPVCSDVSASGTAQSCTSVPTFTPAANSCIVYSTTTANTGTGLTLNVNSLGAKSISKWMGSTTTLAANDVLANKSTLACYDGTTWEISDIGNAPAGGGTGTVTNIASSGPITGGPITTTGTIGCATCGVTGSPLSQFASTTSAQLASVISDETGSGALVFATSPTLVTPLLGTPTSGVITNLTGTCTTCSIGGNAATASAVAVGGITGLGTGVATFLATPSSANLAAAVTDETGTAGSLMFSVSPAMTGTPTAPTQTAGDNTTALATDAFVLANAVGNPNFSRSINYNAFGDSITVGTGASNSTLTPNCTAYACFGWRLGGIYNIYAISGAEVADMEKIFMLGKAAAVASVGQPNQSMMIGTNEANAAGSTAAAQIALYGVTHQAAMAFATIPSNNYNGGAWSSATTYTNIGDVVQSGGISYISAASASFLPPNTNKTPASNPGYWIPYIPPTNFKIAEQTSTLETGTWTNDITVQGQGSPTPQVQSLGIIAAANGASVTLSIPTPAGLPIYLVQRIMDGNAGTATVTIDGSAPGANATILGNAASSAVIKTPAQGNSDVLALVRYPTTATVAAATITNVALTSNVVTLTATNSFTANQAVTLTGLTTATFLNGQTAILQSVSGSQFTINFTHANVTSAAETGTAVPGHAFKITVSSTPNNCTITNIAITSNAVTGTCTNTFSIGNAVFFNGIGTATFLNGVTLTITAASGSSFTASGSASSAGNGQWSHANYSSTADTGSASVNWIAPWFLGTYPASTTVPLFQIPNLQVTGVLWQQNNSNPTATSAYNTQALADFTLLKGDGGPFGFVDVRNGNGVLPGVNPFTDMSDTLHPGDVGHAKIQALVESNMQVHESEYGALVLRNTATAGATGFGCILLSGTVMDLGNCANGDVSYSISGNAGTFTGTVKGAITYCTAETISAATSYSETGSECGVRMTNSAARTVTLAASGLQTNQTFDVKDAAGTAGTANISIVVNGGGTIDGVVGGPTSFIGINGGSAKLRFVSSGAWETVQPTSSTLPGSAPITSATPGTGVTSVTCATAACTIARGTYTVVGGTGTTGTFATLLWPTTTTAYVCSVTMNGGTGFLGLGHSVATATGMTVSAGVTIIGVTFNFDYECQP